MTWGLKCTNDDYNVYFNHNNGHIIILILYVDDLFFTSFDQADIIKLKRYLQATYVMADSGELTKFLGVHFEKTNSGVFLHQTPYVMHLLSKYTMLDMGSTYVPMPDSLRLSKDMNPPPIDQVMYERLIGS